jgi:hypothetical protein
MNVRKTWDQQARRAGPTDFFFRQKYSVVAVVEVLLLLLLLLAIVDCLFLLGNRQFYRTVSKIFSFYSI